jgi:hypothetical protein
MTTPRVAYIPVDSPKMTREALCAAQTNLLRRGEMGIDVDRVPLWMDDIQALINQIDLHRPLGSDGKHGNLHTPTCGCEDR